MRFGGIERLYGQGSLARLDQAHVAVIGLGGVGSWAAEGTARSRPRTSRTALAALPRRGRVGSIWRGLRSRFGGVSWRGRRGIWPCCWVPFSRDLRRGGTTAWHNPRARFTGLQLLLPLHRFFFPPSTLSPTSFSLLLS